MNFVEIFGPILIAQIILNTLLQVVFNILKKKRTKTKYSLKSIAKKD